jgi:hypothetical protein
MGDDNMFADVSGALGACMRAVWKRNDRPWPKPEGVEPSATIDDLAELSAVIRSWGLRKPTARLPIHLSAWKGYSPKSVCSILHGWFACASKVFLKAYSPLKGDHNIQQCRIKIRCAG